MYPRRGFPAQVWTCKKKAGLTLWSVPHVITIQRILNQLLGFRWIRTNFKKICILFEAEVLGANQGISYGVFECFSNFQIAQKNSKFKNIFVDENKFKTFRVIKISGPRFPPMFMCSIEKVCRNFGNLSTFRYLVQKSSAL